MESTVNKEEANANLKLIQILTLNLLEGFFRKGLEGTGRK